MKKERQNIKSPGGTPAVLANKGRCFQVRLYNVCCNKVSEIYLSQ